MQLPLSGEIISCERVFYNENGKNTGLKQAGTFPQIISVSVWYNRALEIKFWRITLSRLIKTDTVGKDRTRLTKAIVLAVRELAKQNDVTKDAKDLAAFIALALQTISDGIDESVAAWEKRDYWVKADRFRMEWLWTGQTAAKMKTALSEDDWGTIAMLMPQIGSKLNKIQVSDNHRLGKPWEGAYKRMKEEGLA
jgi:hypothetical protein